MATKRVGTAVCLVALLGLAGCGSSVGDRALTGATIGAGSGAFLGWVIPGIGPAIGAAIGAGVGGVTGALTTKDQLDIGDPIYEQF